METMKNARMKKWGGYVKSIGGGKGEKKANYKLTCQKELYRCTELVDIRKGRE